MLVGALSPAMASETRVAPGGRTTGSAVVVGVGLGAAVLGLFVAAGFLVAGWRLDDFLARLTPSVFGWVVLAGATAVALVALPVALYLRYRLATPLLALTLVVVGWAGIGLGQGIPLSAGFGLASYAFAFAPLYLLLFLAFAGVEYSVRGRR